MQIKVKLLTDSASLPLKAHPSDAGYDLYATSRTFDKDGNAVYGTGIAMEIPKGYVGLIFPRSSISKYDVSLSNAVGVIDSGYRGEIILKFRPAPGYRNDFMAEEDSDHYTHIRIGRLLYNIGERIGQLIILPIPQIEFETVSALSPSERGEGGYGSSGK